MTWLDNLYSNSKTVIKMNFPLAMWLTSRLVICLVLLGIAPLLNAPPGGIKPEFWGDAFSNWDAKHYLKIATDGYDYSGGEAGALVAFFPLFPLMIRALMSLGIPAIPAGIIINNLAFLGTVILLDQWMNKTHGLKIAHWVILVLVWFPLSLFGTVIYTEGLYLFFSTASLWAFEREKYKSVAIFGCLASATRITSLAMIGAFILTAILKKKGISAYLASFASAGGLVIYSIYCWYRFNDPLAFINVQHTQWQRKTGFDYLSWWKMFRQITIGNANIKANAIVNPLHPLLVIFICVLGYLLWHFRRKIKSSIVDYTSFGLFFFLWILVGDPLLNTGMVLGGIYLLWHSRHQLSLVLTSYGFLALGLLLASGGTMSLNRLVYGIVPITIALGLLLSQNRRWGACVLGFFTLLLITFSLRFAQGQWVA